ncbi:MAG: TonB-dependent receptor [Nitrospirae bacterium]|nr:TonB-dependent receptor [Nitrospirota bacterium]
MKKIIIKLFLALLLSSPAFAEQSDVDLPEVVVTASRLEESLERTPQDVTVITHSDIEKKGVPFVVDLLRLQPDLQVVQNGGPGTVATLLLRGGASSQVLVLVDGIKLNSPSVGTTDLSSLLTSDVERIEIIKGPQSTLYGSEAMAGVVNIITKKGAGPLKGDLSLEGGSFSTYKAAGSVSGGTEKTNYRLTTTYFKTDGIPVAKNGSVANGDTNTSASARLGVNPSDSSSVELNFRYGKDKVNIDNYNSQFEPVDTLNFVQNHETWLAAITGRVFLWEKYEQRLTLSTLWDDLDATDPVASYNSYRIKSKTELFDWQHTLHLHPLTLTGGFVYRVEASVSDGSFDQSIYNKAAYLNGKLGLIDDTLIINAGGRHDEHSIFGVADTYRIGALYDLKQIEMRFKANLGSGFRAPALSELYDPYIGNPDLKPEKSTGFDAGVEKDLFEKKLMIGASYFWQHYNDLIQYSSSAFLIENIGTAQTEGIEVNATVQPVNNLKLNGAYTYLVAVNKDTDAFLTLRPRNKVTSSIEYIMANFTAVGEYLYVSGRNDSSLNRDLSAYSLVNLRGSYLLAKNLSLFARIDNLFNKSYEEIAAFGTPGISVYGGVKASF